MGWGSRQNGRIFTPTPALDRTVKLDEVSKAQLAAALNEQSARFKIMRQQLEEVTRVMVAIVLEPEAFRYADGVRQVDGAAFARVKDGMTLRMNRQGDGGAITLAVDLPAVADIDVPRIVGLG